MIYITSFYRFTALDVAEVSRRLEKLAEASGFRGLCLLGPEGINATCSGSLEALEELKAYVRTLGVIDFKDSVSDKHPFHCFKIKIKDEIVTLGRTDLVPDSPRNSHLSPEEWHAKLQDPSTIVIDTRNDYEVEIGKFKTAIDFGIKEFGEFPEKLRASGIPKDKEVLIYCTGGIRCEKAILSMREQGYEKVHQLQDGILGYLEKFPDAEFQGECFVFDYRVAVDQRLRPTSKWVMCVHCGQPADKPIECVQCGTSAVVCTKCDVDTCSKNCLNHKRIGSRSTRPHLQELNKRHRV